MKIKKTVFVTGGDKGIGKAIVEMMADIYEVVIFTYNTNKLGADKIILKLNNTVSFQCDLRDRESLFELSQIVISRFGTIDILINNAGYDHDAIFVKMEENQWDEVIDVNLRSIFTLTNSFATKMIEKKWGRIINLTSIAGFTGAFGKSNYAAAKAGVVGFTKSLAIELGKKGITVNAIAPGAIKTDMLMRIPDKYREKILENIPVGRFGEAEEVADLVEFLASDKAAYITGQTIHLNGGSYL
jgi:NAD(P)-dependent dehydrogenase (short-subunit alcohol dehydrogenase family)